MIEVDDSTFDKLVLESEKPSLLYFWAQTCKPCKIMGPEIEQIEDDMSGQLLFAETDAVANDDICQRYGVLSTPTIIMFHNGEPVLRIVGYVTRMELRSRLDEQLKQLV
jgi:thioredoxin 1